MKSARRSLSLLRSAFALTLATTCLCGCRSTPKVIPAPPLATSENVFAGTPLSGPSDASPTVTPPVVSQVAVRWVALARMPTSALAPIDTQSRLTISPDSDAAVLTSGRLTRLVRFGHGDAAGNFVADLDAGRLGASVEVANRSGFTAPGATLQFLVLGAKTPDGRTKRVVLAVCPKELAAAATAPADPACSIAVSITDRPIVLASQSIEAQPAASASVVEETALIDDLPAADKSRFVVVLPFSSAGTPWTAIAAIVSVTIPGDALDAKAVTQLDADLKQSAADFRVGIVRTPMGDGPTLHSAFAALSQPDSVRPALLLLTSLSGATIAGDMVLVADANQLTAFAAETLKFAPPDKTPSLNDLRWFFDQYAVRTMCAAAEKNALSPELQSVLAIHAGDAAHRPDAIVDLLNQVGNSDGLAQRLIAENMIALEDNSPAARVRAFDWLTAQGKAPAGFDPLADSKTRHAALDKAMSLPLPPGGAP